MVRSLIERERKTKRVKKTRMRKQHDVAMVEGGRSERMSGVEIL